MFVSGGFFTARLGTGAFLRRDIFVGAVGSVAGLRRSDEEAARRALREADAVCFDVDSTVIVTEGIHVLAACLGKEEEVYALTRPAMEGEMKFEDALEQQLRIIQPTQDELWRCISMEEPQLSEGVKELVSRLRERNVELYLVSGGFRLQIEPVAALLGIPSDHIYANTILFDAEGRYKDFDRNEPTSRSGGKPQVIGRLKQERGFQTVVMIGDGGNDLEAKPPADAFIGYGGVVKRPNVQAGADWFVTSFRQMTEEIK